MTVAVPLAFGRRRVGEGAVGRRSPGWTENSAALLLLLTLKLTRLAGLVRAARPRSRWRSRSTVCAPASSSRRSGSVAAVKVGASLTGVTVMVKVWSARVSTPPLAVPPLSGVHGDGRRAGGVGRRRVGEPAAGVDRRCHREQRRVGVAGDDEADSSGRPRRRARGDRRGEVGDALRACVLDRRSGPARQREGGASLTGLMVMVKVWAAQVSWPPLAVPPLSWQCTRDRRGADRRWPRRYRSVCRWRRSPAGPRTARSLLPPMTKLTVWPASSGVGPFDVVTAKLVTVCGPASSFDEVAPGTMKSGASLTGFTVMVKVWSAEVSMPPLAVPPLSWACTVMVAVPLALAAAV